MAKSNYHNGEKREQCYFCGCGPPLREHHIIPQRFDGPDSKENIVELCDLCHKKIERLYDKRFYEWFGIDDEKGERKFHRQCQHWDCENKAAVKIGDYTFRVPDLKVSLHWRGPRKGLYCRPCVAKLSQKAHDVLLSSYVEGREQIHSYARRARNSEHKRYNDEKNRWEIRRRNRWVSDSNSPDETIERPNASPDEIYDKLVLESESP